MNTTIGNLMEKGLTGSLKVKNPLSGNDRHMFPAIRSLRLTPFRWKPGQRLGLAFFQS